MESPAPVKKQDSDRVQPLPSYNDLTHVDPRIFAPMMGGMPGAGGRPAKAPEYLDFNVRGRSWYERAMYNIGSLYLLGGITGGMYGAVEGWRTAPSSKFNIRVNSLLNKTGRRAARLGNGLGALAFLYSSCELILGDYGELDVRTNSVVAPVTYAALSGMLYKSSAGRKTALLAGALGGSIALASIGLKQLFPDTLTSSKGLLFF